VNGTFTRVTGQATATTDGQVTGSLTIDAASIDTKVAKRDAHLRSADPAAAYDTFLPAARQASAPQRA
jgi:polyisoprenoid-binding protein YceI